MPSVRHRAFVINAFFAWRNERMSCFRSELVWVPLTWKIEKPGNHCGIPRGVSALNSFALDTRL